MDAKQKTSGVISHHELYTLSEFKSRMGLTDTATVSYTHLTLPTIYSV